MSRCASSYWSREERQSTSVKSKKGALSVFVGLGRSSSISPSPKKVILPTGNNFQSGNGRRMSISLRRLRSLCFRKPHKYKRICTITHVLGDHSKPEAHWQLESDGPYEKAEDPMKTR